MSGHHKWQDIRQGSDNELADIRARAEAVHAQGLQTRRSDVLAADVLALLSRLDTLEAERNAAESDGKMTAEALVDARAREEALTEALREICHEEQGDNHSRVGNIAREALSRVSRSEPNCPECGSGLLNGEHIAKYECSRRSEPAPPNEDVCSWCDMHGVCDPGNCPMRPAPPVPEEQQ